jgi:hypothetical protein
MHLWGWLKMALIDKLSAIGDAIRAKTGKTDKLTLDEMPKEIESIKTGGGVSDPVIEPLEITENGIYTAPDGVDGYSPVMVNVQGGGGEENQLDEILNGTITTIDSNVTKIISYGCYGIRALTSVNLPECSSIGSYAFRGCDYLATINAPKVTSLGSYCFFGTKITEVIFPLAASVPSNCFYSCASLEKADFGVAKSIAASAFYGCSKLEALILRNSDAICTLSNANAITNSGVGKGTGFLYVPKNLIDTYTQATNWSTFAAQFRAIEDYPDICGV